MSQEPPIAPESQSETATNRSTKLSARRMSRLVWAWLAVITAELLLVGGGIHIYSRTGKPTPELPDPDKWRTSYPAFCRLVTAGIPTKGTTPEEPILWSAVFLGFREGFSGKPLPASVPAVQRLALLAALAWMGACAIAVLRGQDDEATSGSSTGSPLAT